MSQELALKIKSAVIIPLDRILIVPEIYPRAKVYNHRVQMFTSLLKEGAAVPPILLEECIYKGYRYILVDGRHWIEAYARTGRSEVLAIVGRSLGVTEINFNECVPALRLIAIEKNNVYGMPLTEDERRTQVRKLFLEHVPIERMLGIASQMSLYRWTQDMREPAIRQKNEQKTECLKAIINDGRPISEVAKEKGVPLERVKKWKQRYEASRKKDAPGNSGDNLSQRENVPMFFEIGEGVLSVRPAGKSKSLPPTSLNASARVHQLLDICESLRNLPWDDDINAIAASHLIPLLKFKSKSMKDIFKDSSFAGEIQRLWEENKSLSHCIGEERARVAGLTRENKHLKLALGKAAACVNNCDKAKMYARDLMRKEWERTTIEDINDAIAHIMIVMSGNRKEDIDTSVNRLLRRVYATYQFAHVHGLLRNEDSGMLEPLKRKVSELKEVGGDFNERFGKALGGLSRISGFFN